VFTGIIENIGKVKQVIAGAESVQLRVDIGALADGVTPGDSIAVDGACLTVAELAGSVAAFDVSTETLNVTTLGSLRAGGEVNLERSLRVGDRMGGHFVLGHVDGTGTIEGLHALPGQVTLRVLVPPHVCAQLIPKGSVAVDGISLTVAELGADNFSVAIIPHTMEHTTLRRKTGGDRVNVELDVLGKYVARFLSARAAKPGGRITEDFLAQHGFK
jgi:riboflavin synthase